MTLYYKFTTADLYCNKIPLYSVFHINSALVVFSINIKIILTNILTLKCINKHTNLMLATLSYVYIILSTVLEHCIALQSENTSSS